MCGHHRQDGKVSTDRCTRGFCLFYLTFNLELRISSVLPFKVNSDISINQSSQQIIFSQFRSHLLWYQISYQSCSEKRRSKQFSHSPCSHPCQQCQPSTLPAPLCSPRKTLQMLECFRLPFLFQHKTARSECFSQF